MDHSRISVTALGALVASAFIYTEIVAGAARYYLAKIGADFLIYVPKLMVLGLLLLYIGLAVRNKKNTSLLIFLIFLSAETVLGLLIQKSHVQAIFGLWANIPTLFGFLMFDLLDVRKKMFARAVLSMWVIACLGVFLDHFFHLPWKGFSTELAGQQVSGSRDWNTAGLEINRAAGFSRASFEVASQIIYLCILITFCRIKAVIKIVIWLISSYCIFLTTAKAVGIAFILLSIYFVFRRVVSGRFWRTIFVISVLVSIIFPLSAGIFKYSLTADSAVGTLLLSSFEDRLTNTWPDSIALVSHEGSELFGRGMGGIGVAQKYFEPSLYNPADSLTIYVYGVAGAIGIFLLCLYGICIAGYFNRNMKYGSLIFALAFASILVGIASSVAETASQAIIWGATVNCAIQYSLLRVGVIKIRRVEYV